MNKETELHHVNLKQEETSLSDPFLVHVTPTSEELHPEEKRCETCAHRRRETSSNCTVPKSNN